MILAGGEGNRLGVLSGVRAKPAVPFGGKYRIIDFTLSNCVNSGLTDVLVLTQYNPRSLNDHIGRGRPWDLDRTPGGSSGGSGAALAARFTPLELGSDIGGSIRLPAHMSGVYGHKPSYGIVPAHGQIPGPPGSLTQADLAVAGPMARKGNSDRSALIALAGGTAFKIAMAAVTAATPLDPKKFRNVGSKP